MTLSKREQYIAGGLLGVVVLVGVYEFIFEPFFERGKEISDQRAAVERKLDDADVLFLKQRTLRVKWNDLRASGGLRSDPSEAKSDLMNALESWAQESRVNITTLNSEHTSQGVPDSRQDKPETKFDKVAVHATGFGSMSAVARFMWRIETSPLLLKVTEIQLTSRKDATDDLQLQLSIATISQIPDAQKGAATGSVALLTADREVGQ